MVHDLRISSTRRSAKGCVHLQDLNYDCLQEIFKYLDLAAQFSLLKSSITFYNLILYNIWYPYYQNTFNISIDQSMARQTNEFQIEFLDFITKHFRKIKGISIDIFRNYLCKRKTDNFKQISCLGLINAKKHNDRNQMLEVKCLKNFPNLQELHLEHIDIDFTGKEILPSLKIVTLKNINSVNDTEGDFLKKIFSDNLEKLLLFEIPFEKINFEHFSPLTNCSKLRDLSLPTIFLHDPRILQLIINLSSLQILTLEGNFYFSSDDHTIFYAILKIFNQNPTKTIAGLHLNGVPEKLFFFCPYLKDIKQLNWTVTKIFLYKQDGSLEWKTDIPDVIRSFYKFVVNNGNLETLYVKDNRFHMTRIRKELNFEEKLLKFRTEKKFKNLSIIKNYKQMSKNEIVSDIFEGSLRFFIQQRDNL